METRMSRYKKQRELIDSENQLIKEKDVATGDVVKAKKSFSGHKRKYGNISKLAQLNNKDLRDYKPIRHLDSGSLFSKINTKQLEDVMASIKRARIGEVDSDSTEAILLEKALGHEPTSLIGDGFDDKSSVTNIIREISNDQQNKEITIEREKIALNNLKSKIKKLEEIGIEETMVATFDEDTLARINAIAENKSHANHRTSTVIQLSIILVLLFLVIWLLTFILTDVTGIL